VRAIPVPSISRVAEAITAANRRATVIAVGIGLACASGMLTLALGAKALLLLLTPLVLAFAALVLLLYPERSFEIFLVMLPMYLMSLVMLYGVIGAPAIVIRLIQPWKEIVLLLALIGACSRQWRLHVPITLRGIDWLVIVFVMLNVAYVLFPVGVSDFGVRLAGLRANLIPMPLYVLGRLATSGDVKSARATRLIAILGAAAVIGVVVEKVALPADWPVRIGYSRFLIDFFGDVDVQSADELPWTFWTEAKIFRRPSAFFANPLDLAAGCLIFVGAVFATYLLRQRVGRRDRGSLLLTWGLALTVCASLARMAIATLPVVLAVIAVVLGRRRIAAAIVAGGVAIGAIGLIIAGPLIQQYVLSTVSFQNASSVGHLQAWADAIQAMFEHPFGLGLGSSGAVGARAGGGTGGENQYLIFGVQLGFLGLALYCALVLSALRRLAGALRETQQGLFGAGLAGMLTMSLLGLSSEIGSYIFVLYVTWWLTGYAVALQSGTPGNGPRDVLPQL
jgi:hypothetical protein